jgi:hypothetical protein
VYEKVQQNVGYFCTFQKKLPKANNRPMGKNSPNLVTLPGWGGVFLQPVGFLYNFFSVENTFPSFFCLPYVHT